MKKEPVVLEKCVTSDEAIGLWARLVRRSGQDGYNDHDDVRQLVRNFLRRTNQTELLDIESIYAWFRSDEWKEKRCFTIAIPNRRCEGTLKIMEFLILGCRFTKVRT